MKKEALRIAIPAEKFDADFLRTLYELGRSTPYDKPNGFVYSIRQIENSTDLLLFPDQNVTLDELISALKGKLSLTIISQVAEKNMQKVDKSAKFSPIRITHT